MYVPGASKISGHLILLLEVLKAKAIGNTTITNSLFIIKKRWSLIIICRSNTSRHIELPSEKHFLCLGPSISLEKREEREIICSRSVENTGSQGVHDSRD